MSHIDIIPEANIGSLNLAHLEAFIREILLRIGAVDWQIGLVITDNAGIKKYNRQWRKLDEPTDVLSFVQCEGEQVPAIPGMARESGDVMISLEEIANNAGKLGIGFDDELRRVIIHGILHLDGQDHLENDYSVGMLKMQEELLVETRGIAIDSR